MKPLFLILFFHILVVCAQPTELTLAPPSTPISQPTTELTLAPPSTPISQPTSGTTLGPPSAPISFPSQTNTPTITPITPITPNILVGAQTSDAFSRAQLDLFVVFIAFVVSLY